MSPFVLGMVLVSAVLHASWNAIAKVIPDRMVAAGWFGSVAVVCGAVGAVFLPMPAGPSWPFLIGSAVIQVGYVLLLTSAYAHGEFSRVYPLARGLSPLLVTVVAVTALGEHLTAGELIGIALVCAALGTLVLVAGVPRRGDGLGLAALTGVTIAAYTLVDGIGVQRSESAFGYTAWLFLLHGTLLLVVARLVDGPGLAAKATRFVRPGLAGGVLTVVAYGIVLWAQSFGNLAIVSAVRETSVLFAGVIGAVVFHEPQGRIRILALLLAFGGIVLLRIA